MSAGAEGICDQNKAEKTAEKQSSSPEYHVQAYLYGAVEGQMVLDLQCIHGPSDLQSNNPSSCLGSSLLQSLEQVVVRVGLAQPEQGEVELQELEDAAFLSCGKTSFYSCDSSPFPGWSILFRLASWRRGLVNLQLILGFQKNGRTDGYASFTQDARKPFQTLRASTPFSIHPSRIYARIRKHTQACKAVIGLLV
ncbi:hypothetical protein EYF80_006767 [Liparis tanakae]|uniref:Uncharacterized protein n=1 Tax=Liparis tanakae TaxID=230148 RepID=A0A4Z2IXU9_9TELE|nr:hypothetical protein EYF80_006767 [Liparis tanakae]